jgi:hypothetical protein
LLVAGGCWLAACCAVRLSSEVFSMLFELYSA